MNRSPAKILSLAIACVLAAMGQAQEAPDLNSLLSNSPFDSAPGTGGPAKTDNPVEFRGVFAEGGEYFFNLYIAANTRSKWLGLDETYDEKLTVKTYDADKQQLTVDYQGKTLTLTLGSAKRITTAAAPSNPPPATAQPANQAVQPGPAISDQERLSKIADEIRRRRALRQQALQKNQ